MTDNSKPTDAETQMAKALQQMRAENQRQAEELAAARAALLNTRANIEFDQAMSKADTRPAAEPFALKMIRSEIKNLRLDDSENLVCDYGEHEGISPDAAVARFVEQNEFVQSVSGDNAEGLDLSKLAAKPADTTPLERGYGEGPAHAMMDTDEMFSAAGGWPEAPKRKQTAVRPLTDADRETLSADELWERAGHAPEQR